MLLKACFRTSNTGSLLQYNITSSLLQSSSKSGKICVSIHGCRMSDFELNSLRKPLNVFISGLRGANCVATGTGGTEFNDVEHDTI